MALLVQQVRQDRQEPQALAQQEQLVRQAIQVLLEPLVLLDQLAQLALQVQLGQQAQQELQGQQAQLVILAQQALQVLQEQQELLAQQVLRVHKA